MFTARRCRDLAESSLAKYFYCIFIHPCTNLLVYFERWRFNIISVSWVASQSCTSGCLGDFWTLMGQCWWWGVVFSKRPSSTVAIQHCMQWSSVQKWVAFNFDYYKIYEALFPFQLSFRRKSPNKSWNGNRDWGYSWSNMGSYSYEIRMIEQIKLFSWNLQLNHSIHYTWMWTWNVNLKTQL